MKRQMAAPETNLRGPPLNERHGEVGLPNRYAGKLELANSNLPQIPPLMRQIPP